MEEPLDKPIREVGSEIITDLEIRHTLVHLHPLLHRLNLQPALKAPISTGVLDSVETESIVLVDMGVLEAEDGMVVLVHILIVQVMMTRQVREVQDMYTHHPRRHSIQAVAFSIPRCTWRMQVPSSEHHRSWDRAGHRRRDTAGMDTVG